MSSNALPIKGFVELRTVVRSFSRMTTTTHSTALMAGTIATIGTAVHRAPLPVARHRQHRIALASLSRGRRTMSTTGTVQKRNAFGPMRTWMTQMSIGSNRNAFAQPLGQTGPALHREHRMMHGPTHRQLAMEPRLRRPQPSTPHHNCTQPARPASTAPFTMPPARFALNCAGFSRRTVCNCFAKGLVELQTVVRSFSPTPT